MSFDYELRKRKEKCFYWDFYGVVSNQVFVVMIVLCIFLHVGCKSSATINDIMALLILISSPLHHLFPTLSFPEPRSFLHLSLPPSSSSFHPLRRSQTTTCRSWWWSRSAGWRWCARRSPCPRTQLSAVSNTTTGLTLPSVTQKTPSLSSSRWVWFGDLSVRQVSDFIQWG